MTKSSRLMLVAIVATALTIPGCKKDEQKPITYTTSGISSLSSFFQNNGAQSQFFTIDNSATQTITGAGGTTLTFYPNTFVRLSGAAVTGTVRIELKEVYGKKAMLLSDKSTNAELFPGGPKEPLVSGGEIYLNATESGDQLKLAPGAYYAAVLPSEDTPIGGMQYFRGEETSDGILWRGADSAYCGTSTAPNSYFMVCDSLNWGNADQFLFSPNYTTVSLHLSGTYDADQVKAYVWYDNVNTLWGFWTAFDPASSVYMDSHVASGIDAHFIVISVKNGKLYTGMVATTVATNGSYNVTMTETSETDFMNTLNTLP